MARPISDEELQLKKRARRRLVGAIVLVTAIAVILPMVLDSEPRPVSQNVDIQIPPPDSGEFKPKASTPIKIAPDTTLAKAPESPPKAEPAPARVTGIADPAPATSGKDKDGAKTEPAAPKPAAPEKTVKEGAKGASKEASAGAAGGAYVVQVAALADAAKAKRLEKQMAGAGLQTYTEVVNTKAGEVTRVRAGPYPTRDAAEKARSQLKTVGLDGKVVPK